MAADRLLGNNGLLPMTDGLMSPEVVRGGERAEGDVTVATLVGVAVTDAGWVRLAVVMVEAALLAAGESIGNQTNE